MNKLFTKIAALSVGLAMAIGVGVAVGSSSAKEAKAADTLIYTLDGTSTGGSSGYAEDSEITQNGIKWLVTANTTQNPWRFGGKNLSGVDRKAISTSAVSTQNITKVEVVTGTATATKVNSISILIGSSQGGSDIGSQSKTSGLTSSTLEFARPNNEDWTGRYFTIVFNVDCGTSNQYVQLKAAKFYYDSTPAVTYTVTYSAGEHGSGSYQHTSQPEGTYTLLPFGSLSGITYDSSAYRFKNYTVSGVDKNPGETFNLEAATTVRVNFEEKPPTDTLTATIIGQESYGDWSGKSGGVSNAVYAGNSTKSSHDAIQLRSSNSNSGIVTTTSGGTIKSVTVTWNKTDAPSTARTLDVYAKTTAYSAATDLYSSGTQGTKVGSLSYTNTTTYESTLSISGEYTYVGIRSNSGALYLDDVSFEWELPNELSSIVLSGTYKTSFESGDLFSFGGTVTAKYTKASDANVTSGTTFHLDSASGTNMSGVTMTHAAHDGHTIYAKYTEGGITKTATYGISVANAPVSSVSITIHAAEIGFKEDYSIAGITPTVLPADAVQTTEWVVSANTVNNDYTWNGTKLTSGNTEGSVTLRCRSTADNSKYDEIVIEVSGDPVAAFAKDSTSGYAGKSETVSFTYGNFDAEDIVIASGNTSYVTVGTISASEGSGTVVINFVAEGSTSVTIGDGSSTLDTLTVSVSTDNVKEVTWSASNINVYSGATLSTTGWNVQYEMDSGDKGSASSYTIKLGSATVVAGYEFQASDDGKTMHVEYGGVSSSSISVSVTQSLRPVMAPVPGEESTKTWTATAAANLGAVIESVDGTDTGSVTFDDDSTMSYERTLEFVASGKADYIAFTNNYIQLGSSNALEKVVFTAATTGTVKSIDVDCWSKDGAVSISATVGGNAFGSTQSTPSAKDQTPINFSGSSSGTVVITMEKSAKTAGNAQYIKSIAITTQAESEEDVNIANVAGHEAAQKAVVKFAKAFNTALGATQNCTTGLTSAWATATSAWNTFTSEAAALGSVEEAYAKNLIKYATAQWTENTDSNYEYCLERAMATYEKCVQSHGQTAFMSSVRPVERVTPVNPLAKALGDNAATTTAIVVVSLVSAVCIGGYFFLRRRKEI